MINAAQTLRIEPEFSGASIVLVGNLNPTIFTPDWFLRQGLISEGDRDESVIEVIHPQIAQFKTEWFELVVEPEKFSISTTYDPRIRIFDLVVRTFTEFVSHTPLRSLGINRSVHFRVDDMDVRDQLGRALAPPDAWGEWGPMLKSGEGLKHGGMTSVTMQQRDLDDRPAGHISATVQPSNMLRCGIYVQVNDHYQCNPEAHDGSAMIIKFLKENFEVSQRRSDWIIDQVMRLAHV